MAKRRCKAKTKKGKRCSRYALDGSDVCLAHSPKEVRDSKGFGGVQEGAGRPRIPRLHERLMERIDDRVDEVLDVLFDALAADRGVVVGAGESAKVEYVPDWRARLRAVNELYDRLHGRPRQTIEVGGEDGGAVPVSIEEFADPEIRKVSLELARRVGDARAAGKSEPGRARSGG